jgi:quercetin dioxygenase-like cupin family protein/DNA-binding XRE family transcriptional regulator
VSDNIQTIAVRICDLREISGLTQQEVAEASGVPLEDYIEYEKGGRDFSFSDLLTGESPKLRGYVVTRSGQGLAFDRRKAYHYQHLAYNFRDKKAEPFLVTVEYDGQTDGKTAHAHDGQEFDYLLTGRMLVELGGNKVFLEAGDSVYYDSSLPHAMYALDADAKFIAVVIK